jgi:hypothetical protein
MDANIIKFNNNLREKKIEQWEQKDPRECWILFKNEKNRDPSKKYIASLLDFSKDLNTNKSDRDEYVNINIYYTAIMFIQSKTPI